MGGGASKELPQIRTYRNGELAEVHEGAGGRSLQRERSDYRAPGGDEQKHKQVGFNGKPLQSPPSEETDSAMSSAVSTPADQGAGYVPSGKPETYITPFSPAAAPSPAPAKALPTALKPLGNSSTQGGAEEQLAQVRAELVAQRQATDILTNEVKSLKSQLVSQVANLTHLVMTLAMEKTPDEDPADPTASESADASPAVRESGEGGGRMRTKSGKERGRRMSLNALTTGGV